MPTRTWTTFAQRKRPNDAGPEFSFFGPPGFAVLGPGSGVAEVLMEEDPMGEYWAWIDKPDDAWGNAQEEPLYMTWSYDQLVTVYLAGADEPEPLEAQAAGCGEVVRLRVKELRAVSPAELRAFTQRGKARRREQA